MNILLGVHILAGFIAMASGAVAIGARKGGRGHAAAGNGFAASMLVLGATAAILGPFATPQASPVGGLLVCYFVATSWVTARRRDGRAGRFEKIACAAVLACAGAAAAKGILTIGAPAGTVPGPAACFAFAATCLFAGTGDLIFVLRGTLAPRRRIVRHLWRMCLAFFLATGAFFIGQQDTMPEAVRGSPLLFALGLSPLAAMAFWLVRIRFAKAAARIAVRAPLAASSPQLLRP
jgi:hypothetical protein